METRQTDQVSILVFTTGGYFFFLAGFFAAFLVAFFLAGMVFTSSAHNVFGFHVGLCNEFLST
jgi:hypothetical protein